MIKERLNGPGGPGLSTEVNTKRFRAAGGLGQRRSLEQLCILSLFGEVEGGVGGETIEGACEFSHDGDVMRFAFVDEALIDVFEDWIAKAGAESWHVEGAAHQPPPALGPALPAGVER